MVCILHLILVLMMQNFLMCAPLSSSIHGLLFFSYKSRIAPEKSSEYIETLSGCQYRMGKRIVVIYPTEFCLQFAGNFYPSPTSG